MALLNVNIDHVATIRQARKTDEPDPVWAAALAELGGADGITDPNCAGQDWVRPLTADDVWRRSLASSLRASTGALAAGVVAASVGCPPSRDTR